MGKHLSSKELDKMHSLLARGHRPKQIQGQVASSRAKIGRPAPDLTTVRRALKGATHKRATVETRGRKKLLTARNLATLDRKRMEMIEKADGLTEIHWDDVIKKSRVPKVDRTTAAKSMRAAGYDVRWRAARLKPSRTTADESDRKRICNKLRKLPISYWTKAVDLYMDNKKWPFPTSVRGKNFLKRMKVRGHLRKKSEGLKKGFTKPHPRKHRTNVGSSINVCAAIINCKVKVWHYLSGPWNRDSASALYKHTIGPALVKHRGRKRSFTTLEDNDPTGYKSTLAKQTKRELKIHPMEFPKYSPDLNPLDFSLWDEVEDRMAAQKAPARESIEAFKARLRRTAMAIPASVVRSMLEDMKPRTQSVYDHDGGHIPED